MGYSVVSRGGTPPPRAGCLLPLHSPALSRAWSRLWALGSEAECQEPQSLGGGRATARWDPAVRVALLHPSASVPRALMGKIG